MTKVMYVYPILRQRGLLTSLLKKQLLLNLKGDISFNIIIIGNFNIPLSITDRSDRLIINKIILSFLFYLLYVDVFT